MTTTIVLSILLGMAVFGILLMLYKNEELKEKSRGLKRSVDFLQKENAHHVKINSFCYEEEKSHNAADADLHPKYYWDVSGDSIYVYRTS